MTSRRYAVALVVLFASTQAQAQTYAKRDTRMRSPVLVVSGIGAIVLGVAAGFGGAFLTFWALTSHSCANTGSCDPAPTSLLGAAVPIDLLALAGIGGGIVMTTIGSRRVPITSEQKCTTSDECGALHCIDGSCRAVPGARSSVWPAIQPIPGGGLVGVAGAW